MNQSPKNKVVKRRNYSKGLDALMMEDAFEEAKGTDSPNIASISKKHGVSRKALETRVSGEISLFSSPGRKPLLNAEEEEFLVQFLLEMSAMGFGYNLNTMKKLLNTIMKKDASALTSGWVNYFLSRHPEIALRKTEALNRL